MAFKCIGKLQRSTFLLLSEEVDINKKKADLPARFLDDAKK